MTSRTRRWGLVTVIAAASLAACQDDNSDGSRVPSEAQARNVLQQYVDHAKTAKDATSYCAISFITDTCERSFTRWGGPAAIPSAPPDVVSSGRVVGGSIRVLVVCGTTGEGTPYRTDFPVQHDGEQDELRALVPVFWSGTTFSGTVNGDEPRTVRPSAGTTGSGERPTC